ncbi:hypothetical protein VOM14_27310, partial [Paraburkholderia sp. MPAMCS5]|nr:hypothetical protein [Paraburkholderia sp. MPAMCS5]
FMVDGLLFAGFRLRQSDSQLKPPPPSISRLNSPVHQIRAYLYARPMADLFDMRADGSWTYTAVASTILKGTNVGKVASGGGNQFAEGTDIHPLHGATYWANATKDFDFSKEDRIPPELFNRVLWKGVMGDTPYPAPHSIYSKPTADGSKTVAAVDDDD